MQNIKVFFLFSLFLLGFSALQAQRNIEFSRDPEEFLEQLSYITQNLERRERIKAQEYLDTFAIVWNEGTLLDSQKEWIYKTMQDMQGLRLRPFPDQTLYLNNIVQVLRTREADQNFEAWHKSFQSLLNLQNQRRLIRFWENSLRLFEKNIFYASSVVTWKLQNNNYVLSSENGQARLILRGGDIVCFAQDDSTLIYNTRGEVDLIEERLYGIGGTVTWERAALHPDSVFAQLSSYRINLPAARWEADSVTFYNYNYFSEPLLGKLSERILAEMTPETARYPRFESYQVVHEIENLFPGIDFMGGFTMMGGRVIGSGTSEGQASIRFYRADSLFITARGNAFSILSDRIITQRAAVSIYLSGDSIFHPNINMRYLHPTREFSLLRDEKGFSKAPFVNTFHQLDMYCEAIYWNIDTYEIDLRMIRGISETGNAVFESRDYFSDIRYMRMQGMAQLHPLIRLRNFGREYNSNTFPINEYARYVRGDINSVSAQLLAFSQDGFLSYNTDDETVTLGDKLFHYIGAYAGRTDFDVIQIESEAAVNARINMNNFDLHMYGVDRIPLSDQKNVVLYPQNQQLIMKKNRDIYFDGRIESGLFDFYGREFFFDYDKFKIELVNTDSMSFSVRSFEPDSRGRYSLVRVKTVLEGINGELLVDHPNNKSGQLPYPRYPIFNSNNESFVYYDRDDVQEGVYNREDVYFRLIPFSIDSLDNATTENIAFDGVFISTGIFPDFYDYLTVQPDYSLGFDTQTPEDGYTIYQGRALYKGPINMSYEGLRADGELQYLNANLIANNMLMFPDSARASIRTFNLEAQAGAVEHPDLMAREVDMLYQPYLDNMSIEGTTEPILLYEGLASLKGGFDLTPEGLSGRGELELFTGVLASDNFDFKLEEFFSDQTNLNILAADGESIALEAHSYKSNIHVKNRKSEFTSINQDSKLAFTLNRFDAFSFDFEWDMEAGVLSMENKLQPELDLAGIQKPEDWIVYDFSGHEMVSTHPGQDSLKFYAGNLDYNVQDNIIQASNVKIIKVADAAIFPHQEQVQVLPRAEINKLTNAEILANTSSLLHRFYDAEVNITSRWSYAANGMYDFVDTRGDIQPIYFESIAVDRAFRTTIARAEIEKEHDFTISPMFAYHGTLDLKAENADLYYKGAARIFVDCPNYHPNWLRFEAEINPDSIFIPLAEDLRNDANGRIASAMMLAGDSVHIYPAVFDRQKHYSDMALISAKGYLTYDYNLRQYQISTAEKLHNTTLPDDIISINPHTCVVEGHGNITLSEDLGQFKMVNYGRITHNLHENEVNLDIVTGLDFFFLNSALGMVENEIRDSENTTFVNLNRFKYTSFLQKKTNAETSQRLMAEFIADSAFRRFPAELNHTFFFADLRMKWNQTQQTFYTTHPLGIGNMERFPLNAYVDGFLEVRRQRGGDVVNLIVIPGGLPEEGIGSSWFFFTYAQGIMQTLASDNEYNNMIRNVNPRRRRMDVERGEQPFTYMLSSDRRPLDFVRSMRNLR